MKAVMDVTGNAHALLSEVDGWLKLPLPVGLPAEGPQGGDKGVFVASRRLIWRDAASCRSASSTFPRHCSTEPRMARLWARDFGIPKALRQLLRLLGVLFDQREMVFRLLIVMGSAR